MNMAIDEMKLAVCEKLPELIDVVDKTGSPRFYLKTGYPYREINWPTEGLAVCHEAEKSMDDKFRGRYYIPMLHKVIGEHWYPEIATYEQRLEALTRVWFPEQWK